MGNQRPRIKVPFESVDIILELMSLTLLVLMCIYAITEYTSLPDTIPTHFNSKGEADDFGSKITIFIVPAIALFMYVMIFLINRIPHIHNYLVNITEENALKNYRLSTRLLRIINFLVMILLAYITYQIIDAAKGNSIDMGGKFIFIMIGFSLLIPVVAIIYSKKINKNNG